MTETKKPSQQKSLPATTQPIGERVVEMDGLTYLGRGNPLGKGQPRPSLVIIRNRLKPPFSKPKLTDLAEKPSPEGEE
ncbi:MAG: hypothetical protein QF393_14255 [Rhodospirillales bacterium]|jgi:hypothetical protein|nr:hypothetical protein [Rhodospirillales bacterium]MDP6646532.1 hypothetical protein [Rhodospirillales bacterium]